jgi:enamine deaminase RidA (YjgF/YER057c/UK114 family)
MPRERLNPSGLFKHPYFTRILKVKNPATIVFMAGHTPADENYQPVHPGDLRGQYKAILDALTFQLKEAGATWDDVVFRRMYAIDVPSFMEIVRDPNFPLPWHPDRPSPSTLIGVTALSNPGFLLEIEIVAILDD